MKKCISSFFEKNLFSFMTQLWPFLALIGGLNADVIDWFDWSYSKYWIFFLVVFLVGFIYQTIRLSLFKSRHSKEKIPELLEHAFNKHPILVIDDKKKVINEIKDKVDEQNFDIATCRDIQDYRMVERFQIIVSDINGVSSKKDAVELLQTIKEKYPYKIIIPMSSSPSVKINLGERLVLKDEGEYLNIIQQRLKYWQEKLNDSESFWNDIQSSQYYRNRNPKDQKRIKREYIQYVERLNGSFEDL